MSKSQRVPSGWCITKDHKQCTEFYLKQSFSRGCICSCHPVDKKAATKVDSKSD